MTWFIFFSAWLSFRSSKHVSFSLILKNREGNKLQCLCSGYSMGHLEKKESAVTISRRQIVGLLTSWVLLRAQGRKIDVSVTGREVWNGQIASRTVHGSVNKEGGLASYREHQLRANATSICFHCLWILSLVENDMETQKHASMETHALWNSLPSWPEQSTNSHDLPSKKYLLTVWQMSPTGSCLDTWTPAGSIVSGNCRAFGDVGSFWERWGDYGEAICWLLDLGQASCSLVQLCTLSPKTLSLPWMEQPHHHASPTITKMTSWILNANWWK